MTNMTKREALQQCLIVWDYLAKNPHIDPDNKPETVKYLLGYMPMNSCPACEYAGPGKPDCDRCPMDGWDEEAVCYESHDGEYWRWNQMSTPNGRQSWAKAIADRARRSLENLETEDETAAKGGNQ